MMGEGGLIHNKTNKIEMSTIFNTYKRIFNISFRNNFFFLY